MMRMGLMPFQGATNGSPVLGPLAPFLTPLLQLEAPFNALLQPFFTPFQVDAEGPAHALHDLATGVTPEFVKLFQNLPGFPPLPGNETTTTFSRERDAAIAAARANAQRNQGRGGGSSRTYIRSSGRRSIG